MTTVLLVRHAQCARMAEVLFGRAIDPPLDDVGRRQADAVGALVARFGGVAIEASPRRRTQETAAAIGRAVGTFWRTSNALDEVDFGDWSGQSFEALHDDSRWRRWNDRRGSARTPNGTTMQSVQQRMVGHIASVAARERSRTVALVSHAEPIRAALLYHLDLPLDQYARIDVRPASISTLEVDGGATRVVDVGATSPLSVA